ncbi:gliding motility-associated C-terminal domain-containing protein [Robiginitalea sp. IMCC43444]|uniref:gliding motility-associated C-terminal domain-containing protein n=1 Tax=Robiginitalea sp. IMCC43444 TaxID=3459121 RepID=UPI0040436A31
MHKLVYILFFSGLLGMAQPALQHYGNMQLHDGANVGFHTNFINEGPFAANPSLVGFYGDIPLFVGGSLSPMVYDLEIANIFGVDLETALTVENNVNFIDGDFRTTRSLSDQYLGLLQDAFTVGAGNNSKVNGFALAINKQEIIFPVGDATEYKGLTLQGESVYSLSRCAYFREDPNNPSIYPAFRTDLRPRTVGAVSTFEFWRLEGSSPGTITLSWTPTSNIAALTPNWEDVVLMGWSKQGGRWLELGTATVSGDLNNGFAISETFVPDEYEIITFGSRAQPEELLTIPNFFMSPDGDGINDFLYIEELEQSPNNNLQIYDRNGLKVFEMDNYTNEFVGVANVDGIIINREKGLPEGVYFYLIRMLDLGLEYQGFLYLDR